MQCLGFLLLIVGLIIWSFSTSVLYMIGVLLSKSELNGIRVFKDQAQSKKSDILFSFELLHEFSL